MLQPPICFRQEWIRAYDPWLIEHDGTSSTQEDAFLEDEL